MKRSKKPERSKARQIEYSEGFIYKIAVLVLVLLLTTLLWILGE